MKKHKYDMNKIENLPSELLKKMKEQNIDIKLTLEILKKYNKGHYARWKPFKVKTLPNIDDRRIVDMGGDCFYTISLKQAQKTLKSLDIHIDLSKIGKISKDKITFNSSGLKKIGLFLFPKTAYGVLNGGSASSYIDFKKNKSFNNELFTLYINEFSLLSQKSKGKAKGITPAFFQEDGSPGPSFLELKIRALLIQAFNYQLICKTKPKVLLQMFQMTNVYMNDQIQQAYCEYTKSTLIKDLIKETKINILDIPTGVQPMIAAFSHSTAGKAKTIFSKAKGKENNPLPMPGGHGQNFYVLKQIYKTLYKKGIRFIYLGNVDNIGFTVDPVSLAILALSGKQAGFEFSFRTPLDIKGGVLVIDQRHRLNCADIGVTISKQEIFDLEKQGKKVLFNCAIGLFNLEYLVNNIDNIIQDLPVRFSDQDKDSGRYSQAEQITWEIIGLIDDILIFAVNKFDRFLAVKILLEGLMTSGLKIDDPHFPTLSDPEKDLKSWARNLFMGLTKKLSTVYGMKKINNRWVPKSVAELKEQILKL